MKKNLYYTGVVKRSNPFSLYVLGIFYGISSYPRLMLEVFIRKNFGERYFNLGAVIFTTLLFAWVPYFLSVVKMFITQRDLNASSFLSTYLTWYLFLIAFLIMSFLRWREIRRKASTFDFSKYSLYRGDIHPSFFDAPIFKNRPDQRRVEILLEPGLFFLIGLVLWLMGQGAGLILIICSLLYSLSYAIDYKRGDDYILDIIDTYHMNMDMMKLVSKEGAIDEGRTSNFKWRKPADPKQWESVVEATIVEDDNYADGLTTAI